MNVDSPYPVKMEWHEIEKILLTASCSTNLYNYKLSYE